MKIAKQIFAVVLIITVMISGLTINAGAATFEQDMAAKGFPQSYITYLSSLHASHPNWQFEPILITGMKSSYTFDYVISQEDYKNRNLVTTDTWAPGVWAPLGQQNYSPYYDANDTTLYDSGWRKASNSAVRYFMDPRNFLNDIDIFMFEDLSYFNAQTQTVELINETLGNSFMGNFALCDNGISYAQHIYNCAQKYNVNAISLAARLVQENGSGTSPLVNGTIGDTLYKYYTEKPETDNGDPVWGDISSTAAFDTNELLSYNGYYNFFNIGAGGNGRFAIYYGGGKEAKSLGWDTKAKAIEGGIQKLSNVYINDYQYTRYLQKFNVDPRSSRNFWGQYMQNIASPLTESRKSRQTYANSGALERGYIFRIPVYDGMPVTASPDPASGNSYYSPSHASSSNLYNATININGNGFAHFGWENTVMGAHIGQQVFYRVIPDEGYVVDKITVNGESVKIANDGFETVYSFMMPAIDVNVNITFKLYNPVHTVTAVVAEGKGFTHFGTGNTVMQLSAGQQVFYRVIPDSGYITYEITVNGESVELGNGGGECVYSFTMPKTDVEVVTKFRLIEAQYTVNHYIQNIDGKASVKDTENYTLAQTTTAFARTDAISPIETLTFANRVAPTGITVTPAADGSTVVNCYYRLNYGDVTLDEIITADDIAGMRIILLGLQKPEGIKKALADVNGDGSLSVTDLIRLKHLIINPETEVGS